MDKWQQHDKFINKLQCYKKTFSQGELELETLTLNRLRITGAHSFQWKWLMGHICWKSSQRLVTMLSFGTNVACILPLQLGWFRASLPALLTSCGHPPHVNGITWATHTAIQLVLLIVSFCTQPSFTPRGYYWCLWPPWGSHYPHLPRCCSLSRVLRNKEL